MDSVEKNANKVDEGDGGMVTEATRSQVITTQASTF
jgi:hypothetical protein